MAISIPSTSDIAQKWSRVTPGRSADYADGVRNPSKDWETETLAAADRYAAGIQESLANKSFEKGVERAGTSKWKDKATTLGAQRFGPGVSQATSAFADGFAPYRDVIAGLTLPERFAKGDPRNMERVRVIAEALHDEKVSG